MPATAHHAVEVAGTLVMAWVIGVGGYICAEGGISGPQPFESESSALVTQPQLLQILLVDNSNILYMLFVCLQCSQIFRT